MKDPALLIDWSDFPKIYAELGLEGLIFGPITLTGDSGDSVYGIAES